MIKALLFSCNFLVHLSDIDHEIALANKKQLCPHCGGKLDFSNYYRKTYHPETGSLRLLHYSACCRNDGCRKRFRLPSIRFYDRRQTLMPLFLLVGLFFGAKNSKATKAIGQKLRVSYSSISRWRKWFKNQFLATTHVYKIKTTLPDFCREKGCFVKLFLCAYNRCKKELCDSIKTILSYFISDGIDISTIIADSYKSAKDGC